MHTEWFGRYDYLEHHHGYVQWLFPIPEDGVNPQAQRLHHHEAASIRADEVMQRRVARSLELMYDFYGIRVADWETVRLERTEHYETRYENLIQKRHNWLRMTRILKSIGMLGLANHQAPLCRFLLEEMKEGNLLPCIHSLREYWIAVVLDDHERKALLEDVELLLKTMAQQVERVRIDKSSMDCGPLTPKHKPPPTIRNRSLSVKGKRHPMDFVHKAGCSVM